MIEIRSLGVKYGDKIVYDNFDLDIAEGGITCVLGESGCGKTTLLNAVAGLVTCMGDIPRLKCAYVFQTPRLVPNLTVGGNLRLVCKDGERVRKLMDMTGLAGMENRYPSSLSGGEAQRVAIARAFLYDCDILLMDEPFSSLDLKLKISIMDSFSKMREDSATTTLFVTHDIDEALYLSDDIALIKDGKIAYNVKSKEKFGYGEHPARRELISEILK